MRRRSFLKAMAGAAPVAGLQDFLITQARAQSASPPASALHVVGAGEDRFGRPHSLGFSSILFKVPASETAGGLFVMEHTHLLPGGPALHLHFNQEEWFYVMEGEVAFQVGEQRLQLHGGESVLAPRRVPQSSRGCGIHGAIRDAAGRAISVLEVVDRLRCRRARHNHLPLQSPDLCHPSHSAPGSSENNHGYVDQLPLHPVVHGSLLVG